MIPTTEPGDEGKGGREPATGTVLAFIVGFVVVGGPLVYFLWDALNHLLAARPDRVRWAPTLISLILFGVLLLLLARGVRLWNGGETRNHREGVEDR